MNSPKGEVGRGNCVLAPLKVCPFCKEPEGITSENESIGPVLGRVLGRNLHANVFRKECFRATSNVLHCLSILLSSLFTTPCDKAGLLTADVQVVYRTITVCEARRTTLSIQIVLVHWTS